MSLDGLAGIQSRIAGIQQRFTLAARPPVVGGTRTAAGESLALSGSLAGGDGDFASMLAEATSTLGGTAPGAASPAATATTTRPAGPATPTARAFVDEALRQSGDPYVWGSNASPSDADPDAFDCSELTRWAAKRVGIDIPDGSWLQYLELKQQGALVPVEQALRTPGALLFSFSEEPRPGGGRPSEAHVAISLGNGRTIEARGRKYGVGTFDAADRFQYGAVIPGM